MRKVFLLLYATILVGCGGIQPQDVRRDFDAYLGRPFDEVVRSLGVPTSCINLNDGKRLCEWDRSYVSYGGGAGGTVTKRYHIVVDATGKVEAWQWKGPIGWPIVRVETLQSQPLPRP